MDQQEKYYSTAQIAKITNTSKGTRQNWRSQGIGPKYVRIGRSIRYRLSAVEKWLNENQSGKVEVE